MGERWWQRGILYQVYPRSYVDANGDGVGDLPGVISRLDYLEWLGVDALWPLADLSLADDFGYDVADYTGVDPLFGTLEDFDRLVAQRARGLKVVLDFVPNHTSDQHPWFRESGASRDNPKRDWYLWRDAPNNWLSNFGGSAWQFDEATGQYYYHAFLPEQPDLNWRNPEVVQAMLEVPLLARARRRRLPRRRALAPREGRAFRRQPGEPGVARRHGSVPGAGAAALERSARSARGRRSCAGCSTSIPSAC